MKKIKIESLVFWALIAVFIIVLHQDMARFDNIERKSDKIKNAIILEKDKQTELTKRIKDLNNSDETEVISRQRLMLIKNGETAYKVIYR